MSEALFSRSGNTCPLGKCTEELKTAVPEDAKNAVIALAFASGITPAEYLRNIVFDHLYGRATMLKLQQRSFYGQGVNGANED